MFSGYKRSNPVPSASRPRIPGAVDDLQMPGLVEEAGVAGVDPAVLDRLPRRLGVLEVALEDAGAAEQYLARLRDLDLHPRHRGADRVEPDVTVPLHGHEHAGLGHAVELLDVDADGAEEDEDLGAEGLAGRVGDADAPHPQVVAQRPADEQATQGRQQPRQQRQRLAGEPAALEILGQARGRRGSERASGHAASSIRIRTLVRRFSQMRGGAKK